MTIWQHSLIQQVDQNGAPDRWSVSFVRSGTSVPVIAYKDPAFTSAHNVIIQSDSWARLPAVHLKPDGVLLDARITFGDNRVQVITGIDPGAPPTPAGATATPKTPVVTRQGVVITLTGADAGRVVTVPTASGANAMVYLPKAADVPDGVGITVKNNGSGVLMLRCQTANLIDGVAATVLTRDQEAVTVTSSGAGYETVSRTPPPPKRVLVKSRTALMAPAIVNPGDVYIGAPDSEPSGAWTANYLMTALTATGVWTSRRPELGDTAVIESEMSGGKPIEVTWTGVEWADTSRRTAQMLVARDEYASGTGSLAAHGGTQPTANFWTRSKLSTLADNTITGSLLSADVITLPKGSYRITARRRIKGAITGKLAFRSLLTPSKAIKGMPLYLAASEQGEIVCDGRMLVTADTEAFELVFILAGTVAATTLGDAAAISGEVEAYAEVVIQTLSTT